MVLDPKSHIKDLPKCLTELLEAVWWIWYIDTYIMELPQAQKTVVPDRKLWSQTEHIISNITQVSHTLTPGMAILGWN